MKSARALIYGSLLTLTAACMHQSAPNQTDSADFRFYPKKVKANYVLDSEVTMGIKNEKGKPILQVDLPHSRGCQVTIDEEFPGNIYPEHITNAIEKIDPVVFVLKYDSKCLAEKNHIYGEHTLSVPLSNQIDIYGQIIDAKLPQFKKDFESGNVKIAVCRYWECSNLISYKDSLTPLTFFHTEYQPPQFFDLKLGEMKSIRADVPLVEAIYGPPVSVCDGRIKQAPTLNFALFLPSLPKKLAANHQSYAGDDRYIFRFYKGNIVSKEKAAELAKSGQVFCSLRIIEQRDKTVKKPKEKTDSDTFDFAPIQALAYASNLGATFYSEADKALISTQFFSRTFELYGTLAEQNVIVSGGFCSTPHGDSPMGRQVLVGDIVEHIPGVTLTTNYPAFYSK